MLMLSALICLIALPSLFDVGIFHLLQKTARSSLAFRLELHKVETAGLKSLIEGFEMARLGFVVLEPAILGRIENKVL